MELYKKFKQLRISKGLTQRDIAEYLNIHPASYANYENGKRIPDIQTLVRIADFYNLSIDSLLGRKQETFQNVIITEPKYRSELHKEIHRKIDLLSQRDLLFVKRIIDTMDAPIDKTKIVEEK